MNRLRTALAVAAATSLLTVGLVATSAAAVDPLISQGKVATASSQESTSRTPALAVDGSLTTRWASALNATCDCGQNNEWLQVDLAASYHVTQVTLSWEAAYATSYKIQTSADGTAWTDVHADSAGNGGTDTIALTGATGRYVRMQGVTRATQWGYSLWELRVYGTTVVSPPPTTTPPAPGGPTGSTGGTWVQAFADEFDGTALDLTKWRPNFLGSTDTAITKGANSAETACMAPANATVSGGAAHLALTAQSTSCNGITKPHRGAMIQSYADGHTFAPGGASNNCNGECYMEARLRTPATSTAILNWPAFWTNGVPTVTWPQGGENDVMEGLGNNSTTGNASWHYHYYDGSSYGEDAPNQAQYRDGGWHTFGTQWTGDPAGTVRYYYDGVLVGTITGAETDTRHYLLLTYTNGTWGGPLSTGKAMDVDYVRVWRR